jgi:predicted xylose isomerase-like sugar epimerase
MILVPRLHLTGRQFSCEPFAAKVHELQDPAATIRASMDYLSGRI